MAEVESGLKKVEKLVPGAGFLDLNVVAAGVGDKASAMARGEIGAKLTPNSELFGFGEVGLEGRIGGSVNPAWQVGAGYRLRW